MRKKNKTKWDNSLVLRKNKAWFLGHKRVQETPALLSPKGVGTTPDHLRPG
jgi:hypothetical protein